MTLALSIDIVAAFLYEVNTIYCMVVLGQENRVPWALLPSTKQESLKAGIALVLQGVRPPEIHEYWMKDMVAHGWVWGPVLDPAQKVHPALLPWRLLSVDRQIQDRVFHAVIQACCISTDEPTNTK